MDEIEVIQGRQPFHSIGAGGDSDNRIDETIRALNFFSDDRETLETEIENLWIRYQKIEDYMRFLKRHFPTFDSLHLAVVPIFSAMFLHYMTTDWDDGITKVVFTTLVAGFLVIGVLVSISTYMCMLCKMNDFYLKNKACSCFHHQTDQHERDSSEEDSESSSSNDETPLISQNLEASNSTAELANSMQDPIQYMLNPLSHAEPLIPDWSDLVGP